MIIQIGIVGARYDDLPIDFGSRLVRLGGGHERERSDNPVAVTIFHLGDAQGKAEIADDWCFFHSRKLT